MESDYGKESILLHTAELIKFRDERKVLLFILTNGETIEGTIRWFDEQTIHLVAADRSEITVFKHALTQYSAKP